MFSQFRPVLAYTLGALAGLALIVPAFWLSSLFPVNSWQSWAIFLPLAALGSIVWLVVMAYAVYRSERSIA